MLKSIRPAVAMLVLFTLLTGLAYPLAITAIAQLAFAAAANGSLVLRDGKPVGSILIGQYFAGDSYFHSRPSATQAPDPKDPSKTVDAPYNAANSGGSNLAMTSKTFIDRVKADIDARRASGWQGAIPADAVTTSGSGLDPHITPANAAGQIVRVAKARGLAEERVRALVEAATQTRSFGVLGEPLVNVLALNLALDRAGGVSAQ